MDDINLDSDFSVDIDAETLNVDFDDIDLYGTKLVEDSDDDCDIEFE